MDTNQQPKAAYLAQELKAGKWAPNILQNEVALRQCAAEELLRLQAENEALRTGYNAARLEIESLQTRVQELGQQARECSDRKVVQLESALARHVRSGKDWAMRAEALERTITTLRAQIASRSAQAATAEKAMRELESANSIALQLDARIKELEAQLDAVGAGGVEPLRKRECLHQIDEQAPSEWDVRGHLAASLTCWPRLTGQEASELVALFHGRSAQASAPVVLPEPMEFQYRVKPDWDEKHPWTDWEKCKPESASDYLKNPALHNWTYEVRKLYTEQQVRALLAAAPKPPAHEPLRKRECLHQIQEPHHFRGATKMVPRGPGAGD